jgi:uncharacterized protein with GYD domain
MAKYIMLINWTEQGIRNVEKSPDRLDAGRALAKKLGGEIRKFYMTMGAHDIVAILELPNDEAAAKFALSLAKGGNVRTTTMKAFSESTYRKLTKSAGKGK